MSQPYVGEIRLFAGNFAPVNWRFCDGSLLPISQFDVLFNLIGTTYGGDGQSTFALPDLRSRVPIHQGTGAGLPTYIIGQSGGVESVTLTTQQIPSHNHALIAAGVPGTSAVPSGTEVLANESVAHVSGGANYIPYTTSGLVTMAAQSITATGGSQPHDNIQPYLAINFIISLYGIYPSQ